MRPETLPVKTRCTTSCHLRSTVSTCKAWTEPSSKKVSNSSRLCACGSVVSLLGTRRDCSLRWRWRFDLTSNRNGQGPYAARATTLLLPAPPAIHVRSGLHGVPSLAAHRSLRVHHHKHRRVIWTTAKDQKNIASAG